MFFGVLGPVAVWTDRGEPVPVSGLKVRALLAVLLVHEGRPVPATRLIDNLWGENLPGDPVGTLSGKVTQLRRVLGQAEPGGRRLVVSPPPGYSLRIGTGTVDAYRFRSLTARARETADARTRAGLLSEALALWRGPPFADFADEPFIRTLAARLTEERLAAQEDQAEARLALGEHAQLVAELTELLAGHPRGNGCGPPTCGPSTGPGGRARRWTATRSSASTWPRSWAWIPALTWSPCTAPYSPGIPRWTPPRRSWRPGTEPTCPPPSQN